MTPSTTCVTFRHIKQVSFASHQLTLHHNTWAILDRVLELLNYTIIPIISTKMSVLELFLRFEVIWYFKRGTETESGLNMGLQHFPVKCTTCSSEMDSNPLCLKKKNLRKKRKKLPLLWCIIKCSAFKLHHHAAIAHTYFRSNLLHLNGETQISSYLF